VNRFCSSCGQQARPDDRFCIGCGREVNADAAPASDTAFRAPEHPRRRTGNLVVRHSRALMALAVVATIGVGAALSGSPEDTNPTAADAAPAADVLAEQRVQEAAAEQRANRAADLERALEAVQSAREPSTKPREHKATPQPSPEPVAVRGSNGKTYMCDSSAIGKVDAKQAVVKRREKVLKTRRRAVRALIRKYPGRSAPPSVVDRYEWLRARANAQVRFTNRAIDAYNQTLRTACDPD